MIAHNGSEFDSFVVLNNLLQWRSIVKRFKNGAGIISLKTFIGYVDSVEKFLNIFILDVGKIIIKIPRKIGLGYKSSSSFLKQEMEHDEIYEDTWEAREKE